MVTNDKRGTKLTCQSEECGARFYDLNNKSPACPVCGKAYKVAPPPETVVKEKPKPAPEEKPVKSMAEEGAQAAADKDPDEAAVDELADLGTDDEISDDDENSNDTLLVADEDEKSGDVKSLVSGASTPEKEG